LQNLAVFRGKHKGERCFIVANGPSLINTNLNLIANETSVGLNRIYLYFEEIPFRPTYYLAINELVLEQFAPEIQLLKMQKFLNWNRRAYFPDNKQNIIFLKSKLVMNDSFQYDLTKPMVFGGTVTFVALQLAYYMGFQKVVIVGLDHKYVDKGIPSDTKIRTEDKDISHFHHQYFPKGIKWQLPDLLRSEMDFILARQAFEKDGRQILDATIGGHCLIFEKTDYESLFTV